MTDTCRLSAYGHSYAAGDGATHPARRFVDLVAAELGYISHNRAVGGSLSTQTAALVQERPPPAAAIHLLMTGANDARRHGRAVTALDDFAHALRTLLTALVDAGPGRIIAIAQPYLLDYTRHKPFDQGSAAAFDDYNQVLRDIAAEHDRVVVCTVDDWDPTTMIAPDTVHPNDLGHRAIANAVLRHVSPRTRVSCRTT